MSTEPLCGEPDCPLCPDEEAIDHWLWRCNNDARSLFGKAPLTFEDYQEGAR